MGAPRTAAAVAERESRDRAIRERWAQDPTPENRQLLAARWGVSEERIRDITRRQERPARRR